MMNKIVSCILLFSALILTPILVAQSNLEALLPGRGEQTPETGEHRGPMVWRWAMECLRNFKKAIEIF